MVAWIILIICLCFPWDIILRDFMSYSRGNMKIIENPAWVFYIEKPDFDNDKIGKWMCFFKGRDFIAKLCQEAVEKGVVAEAKHSNANEGVSCFYLNCDDMASHKKVIEFFLNNNLIRKTKNGKLYNISFKMNKQTQAGEYGKDFKSEIKLEQFVDLNTGDWII